jgi:hypothetical protein
MELPRPGLTQRRASKPSKGRKSLAVIILGGNQYEIGRFNIGELKRMTEVVDGGGSANGAHVNVIERSRQLVEIALARKYPDLRIDDDLETDMAELNAAAAAVIDTAGFVMVGKPKAGPATA